MDAPCTGESLTSNIMADSFNASDSGLESDVELANEVDSVLAKIKQLEQKNSKLEKELDTPRTKAPEKRAADPKRIAKTYTNYKVEKQKGKDEEKAAHTRLEKSLKTALCRSSGTGLRHNRN